MLLMSFNTFVLHVSLYTCSFKVFLAGIGYIKDAPSTLLHPLFMEVVECDCTAGRIKSRSQRLANELYEFKWFSLLENTAVQSPYLVGLW